MNYFDMKEATYVNMDAFYLKVSLKNNYDNYHMFNYS